jgi:hypothetical protein
VSSTATRLAGRVVVGVLFVIAAGFGVAAAQIALAQAIGPVWACIVMAVAFIALALILAMVFVLQQRHQETLLKQSAQQSALMSGLMSASPAAIMGGVRLARLVGRRAPLFVLGALAGGLVLARSALTGERDDGRR